MRQFSLGLMTSYILPQLFRVAGMQHGGLRIHDSGAN